MVFFLFERHLFDSFCFCLKNKSQTKNAKNQTKTNKTAKQLKNTHKKNTSLAISSVSNLIQQLPSTAFLLLQEAKAAN